MPMRCYRTRRFNGHFPGKPWITGYPHHLPNNAELVGAMVYGLHASDVI